MCVKQESIYKKKIPAVLRLESRGSDLKKKLINLEKNMIDEFSNET